MPKTGSTAARGYGAEHQHERLKWERIVKAGEAECTRCKLPIKAHEPFDLDHTDDRTGYAGVAHPSCNRSVGGRNGAAVTNAARSMTIREW